MVRVTGLEPAHLSALEPKSNVSASFTTPAHIKLSVGFHLRTVTGNKCTEVSQPKSNVSANFTTPAYNKSMQAKLACYGAPSGARTQDPLIKSQLLYQLS